MSESKRPFADAERFTLEDEGKVVVWVVLAITDRGDHQYALLAPEGDLGGGEGDMDVMVCEYLRDPDGNRSLKDVTDETLYESIYREIATNMGLEDSVEH